MYIHPRIGAFLMAGVVLAAGIAPEATMAKVALHLDLRLGSSCVSGYKPTAGPIKVKLLRADGHALASRHDDSISVTWSVCFDKIPVAGNRLQMINGTDEDRTITVPNLTVVPDRVSSVVSGHAPAHKPLVVRYTPCSPVSCGIPVTVTTTTNGHGRYRTDLSASSIDIDGSDGVSVEYQNIRGDRFSRTNQAPYVEISKPNRIFVSCLPRGTTTVRLLSSSGTVRATRSFTATVDCTDRSGTFRRGGRAVNVHSGDRITSDLASDASLTWPPMAVGGSAHLLSGRCLTASLYDVAISRGSVVTSWSGMTDATGHLSATLASWTFQPGDRLELTCETGRGDRVQMTRTLPL